MVLRLPRLRHSVQLGWVSLVLAVLAVRSLQAQTQPVGQISTPQTATVTISTSGTPNAINVVTQGAPNLDFKLASGGTCSTSTAYTSAQTCTVNYTFTPTHPGVRYGGIILTDASGNILGSAYVLGTGTGPQITFSGAGHQEPILAVTGFPIASTVDAGGNYYIADLDANGIYIIPAGCTDGSCYKLINIIGLSGQDALAVDGIGNLYLADENQTSVLKFPPGCLSTSCDVSVGGGIAPVSVAVDGNGKVYVADGSTNFIKQMPSNCADASCVTQLGGTFSFNLLYALAVDVSGNVYVADYFNGIYELTPGCTDASCVTILTSNLYFGSALAVDGLGNLFVGTQYIGIFEMPASCLNTGCYYALEDPNHYVTGIAVDGSGNVYYSDYSGRFDEIAYSTPPILEFVVPTADGTTDTAEGSPTVVITNAGNQPLTFNIPASGTNPAVGPDFTVLTSGGSACPSLTSSAFDVGTLAAGASCNLPITFTPVQPSNGVVSESVTLTDNSLNQANSTQAISMTGTASSVPLINSVFPSQGSISGGTQVTIAGSGFTGITSVMFGLTPATSFAVSSNTSITAVSPASNLNSRVDVVVTGPTGSSVIASPDLFYYLLPTNPSIPAEPIGTTSSTLTMYIPITQAGTLSTINVLTGSTPNLDFTLVSGGSCTVSQAYTLNQFCAVNITFTPTLPGTRSGSILLKDGSGNVLGSIGFQGTGNAPQLAFIYNGVTTSTPPSIVFPTSTADYSQDLTDGTKTVTLMNTGNQPLTFSVPVSGTNFSVTNSNFTFTAGTGTCPQLTPGSTAATLAAGASCTIPMTFNPVAPASGTVTGSITISDNNLDVVSTQTIPLTGTATLQVPAVTNVSPNVETPAGGTPVTITGSGFTGATAVNFGSTPAISFTVNSDTSITAIPPANGYLTTVDVIVTGPNGTSTPNGGDSFTYYLSLVSTTPNQLLGQTSAVQTAYLYFGFPGTLAGVNVLTQGTANLDFKFVSGGTCTPSVTYVNNQVCTVNYTFAPAAAGLREGSITLTQSDGTVLGYLYVQGEGDGPQLSYRSPTTTIKTLGAGAPLADALAVDTGGNIYYSSGADGTVHYIPAGCMSSVCEGQIGSSFLSQSGYSTAPNGLSVDGMGYLYVANSSSSEIDMVPSFCTSCRVPLGGPQFTYNYPSGIYVDGGGNIFVADTLNSEVAIMPAHCGGLACVKFYGGFSQPTGITTDIDGNIYVADGVLKKYPLGCITCSPTTMGGGIDISSMALDGSGKNIYTVSIFDNTLRTMPADCTSTSCVTTIGTFLGPSGVGVDGAGNIYVADSNGVHEIITSTPTTIPFATTTPDGATDLTDGTQTLTLTNIGNQPLNFTIPVSGNNPSIGPDFTFNQGSGTCPVVTSASSATSLAASASCTIPVTFTPVGAANGALNENLVLTSNNFNVTNATQTIPLTGTASGPSPVITNISPASGITTGGTSVTITGNGFTGTTSVKFGTTNATSFTVNGATSITAVSPVQSAGTVADVKVTNGGVTSATSAADQFTYALQPKTITFPQPVTPVAVGAQATLSATASSGDPTTYSITGGTASLSGNVVTYTTKGTVTITANSAATGIYAAASPVSVTVSVHPQEVFIANTGGTVASLFGTGVSQSGATSGGGIGAAVDAAGDVWSINANGSGVSVFTDAGALSTSYSGSGIGSAKALAIDGNNITWIANGNGTVSALTNAGANALMTPIDPMNGTAAPSSISVDTAGSLWLAIPNTTTPSSSTVIEVIGSAAPISTPTVTQVINSTTGTKP